MTKLTENETQVLNMMVMKREVHDATGIVTDCRPAQMAKTSFPGVVASLVKKGLIETYDDEWNFQNHECFQFTKKGARVVCLDTTYLEIELPGEDSAQEGK